MSSQLSSQPSSPLDRRAFLKTGTAVAAGIGIATPFHALLARADQRRDHGAIASAAAAPITARSPR
jgi:hypothetical protein